MAFTKIFLSSTKQQQVVQTLNDSDNTITTQIFETWIVEHNDINLRAIDVLGATADGVALPKVAYSYSLGESATSAYCKRVQPQAVKETPYAFEVQVEYATPQIPPNTTKLTIAGVPFNQVAYFDKDDKPIVNSAGQPFDPSLSKTYYDMKFGVSYQTTSTPPVDDIYAALGKVCDGSVTIAAGGWSHSFDERELKMDDAALDFAYQGGQLLWTVNLSCLARSDTFIDKLLDQGFSSLDSSGKLQTVLDKTGNPLNAPVQLNGSGGVLASGATAQYITFKVEDEADMSSIFSSLP